MSEKIELHKEWRHHISLKHTVMMDNDGWWFSDGENWVSGGDGPYGVDLCEFLLTEIGVKMEFV